MSGSSETDQVGTYGSLGTPAPGNVPGARSGSVSWTDGNGNLWLFGGKLFVEQLRPPERPLEVRPRARPVELDGRFGLHRPGGHVRDARDTRGGEHPWRAKQLGLVDGWEREALALRGNWNFGGGSGPPERPLEIRPGDRAVDLDGRVERTGQPWHVRNTRCARGGKCPWRTVRLRLVDGRKREALALRGKWQGGGHRKLAERPLEVRPRARAVELDERFGRSRAVRNVRLPRDSCGGERPWRAKWLRLVDGRERKVLALRRVGLRGGGCGRPERPLEIRPGDRAVDLDGRAGRRIPVRDVRIARDARAGERSRVEVALRLVDGRKREALALRGGRPRQVGLVRRSERSLEIRPGDRPVDLDGRTGRSLPGRHVRLARDARAGKRPRGTRPVGVVDGRKREPLALRGVGLLRRAAPAS